MQMACPRTAKEGQEQGYKKAQSKVMKQRLQLQGLEEGTQQGLSAAQEEIAGILMPWLK